MCGVRDPFGYKCWIGTQIGTQIGHPIRRADRHAMQAMSADEMQDATLATQGTV
jgi:hypothetical protein